MSSDKHNSLKVMSPLSGWCAGLEDNPDAVFSGRILGDGMSIDPTAGEVRAPFDAQVLTLPDSRHAINLRAGNGAEFLIHIGIDSVKMAGDGFEAHVAAGDAVKSGQLLLSFDLEKVLRGAASLKTPVLLLHSETFELKKARAEGPVSFADELFEVCHVNVEMKKVDSEPDTSTPDTDSGVSKTIAVGLEHGIHARPAAALIMAIKDLKARVFCQIKDKQPADALSAVALMSLGVSYGDTITVTATGKDAKVAVDAFVALLEPKEVGQQEKPVEAPAAQTTDQPAPLTDGTVIPAQAASPGLCAGNAFRLDPLKISSTAATGSVDQERQLLDDASKSVRIHLQELVDSDSGTGSEIAAAHLALLDDPMITRSAQDLLTDGCSAATAWQDAVNQAVTTLSSLDDQRMLERVDDLRDINLRVQQVLAGQDPGKGPKLPANAIVVAENLLPSQLLELDRERLVGICLAAGGVTSHVAILAISLNIPMLVAAGSQIMAIKNDDRLLIDAEFGELQYQPNEATQRGFESRIAEDEKRRQTEQATALNECRTIDDTRIHIMANLASPTDAREAVASGAEGCGLLRTEFVFMDKNQAPDSNEQLGIYQQFSTALGARPLVVRTLDAGGDKPINYIEQEAEENPALGVRGIRLSLNNKDMLASQLKALLRLNHAVPLQIMIPMVSSVHEVTAVREMLDELIQAENSHAELKLGVMIETPAAALIADRLANIVDFFSIGTNDLTQYTLCMDRGEPQLASRLDTLHPAVLTLIKNTVDAAAAASIPVAVCGGAAGDMLTAPILLGLGIRELSMPKSLIARQKARLRRLSIEQCRTLATDALAMSSAREVRSMMRQFITQQSASQQEES